MLYKCVNVAKKIEPLPILWTFLFFNFSGQPMFTPAHVFRIMIKLFSCRPPHYSIDTHRSRIKIEEKAKVVAAVWGQNQFISPCLATLLQQDDLKNRMNCTGMIWRIGWIAPGQHEEKDEFIPFFKSSLCKIASAERNWINSFPLTAATTFVFLFFLYPSSMTESQNTLHDDTSSQLAKIIFLLNPQAC